MSAFERADSVSAPAFTRADTAPRAAATSRIHGPSYAGSGALRPAPNVMRKPFANIIPALAPAAHIPAYVPPPKSLRPQSAGAALTHKTAGVQSAAASAAAAAADASENSRFKILSLETGRQEDETMHEVERMSAILKKWGYRERMSQAAGNPRDERAILKKISQNHELLDDTHTEFERFMILAREETARMSAEVKKLFSLSMEAAAKLEALDQEETELLAAANIRAPNPSAAAGAVAAAASGYMGTTPSRSYNLSNFPRSPAAHALPDDEVFTVDFTLAAARSRLAALEITPASSSSPIAAQANSPAAVALSDAKPPVTTSVAVPSAAASAHTEELPRAAAPSVSDVRKDMAAKRRLALQQALQSQ